MSSRLLVRSVAESDITEAALWYEDRAAGVGAQFLRAVDVAIADAVRLPARFPVVHRQIRRVLLRRFPYAIYFTADKLAVTVIACMHAHRDPHSWQRRVSEEPQGI